MNARQSVGEPAQPKDIPSQPFVFEWYENRIQRDLQVLYRSDQAERQKIVEIMEEMSDANLFWKLMGRYDDTVMTAGDNETAKTEALMALLARVYIVGSLRGARVLDL